MNTALSELSPITASSSSATSDYLLPKKSFRRFNIEKVHLCGVWLWGEINDKELNCVICDNAFEMPCTECTKPGDSCPPAYGACAHVFHLHCIGRWLNRLGANREEQGTCPMCRQTWQFVTEDLKKQTKTSSSHYGDEEEEEKEHSSENQVDELMSEKDRNSLAVTSNVTSVFSAPFFPSASSSHSMSSVYADNIEGRRLRSSMNLVFSSHPQQTFANSNFVSNVNMITNANNTVSNTTNSMNNSSNIRNSDNN